MKKMVLIMAAAVLGTVSASAQFFVGGSLDYHSFGVASSLTFAPHIGYTVRDKLELGVNINYESSDLDGDGKTALPEKVSTTTFGAFGRYKFLESDKLSLWGQANFGVQSPEGQSIVTLDAFPVVKYALSDKINLTSAVNLLNFSYTSTSYKANSSQNYTEITIGAGGAAPIAIGVEYKF